MELYNLRLWYIINNTNLNNGINNETKLNYRGEDIGVSVGRLVLGLISFFVCISDYGEYAGNTFLRRAYLCFT